MGQSQGQPRFKWINIVIHIIPQKYGELVLFLGSTRNKKYKSIFVAKRNIYFDWHMLKTILWSSHAPVKISVALFNLERWK